VTSQGITQTPSLFDFGPLAQTYGRWYATADGVRHDMAQKRDVLRFLGRAETEARLLDVGCGTGHWSRFFATLGYSVVGIDLSLAMVRVAHSQRTPETTFQVADACALPFERASFDVVTAMATIEFVITPSRALKEMMRCLRRGGRALIGTLNRDAPLNRERLIEKREPYASGHMYSPGDLRDLLEPLGRVRVTASNPDDAFSRKGLVESGPSAFETDLNGPFIIAEVRA